MAQFRLLGDEPRHVSMLPAGTLSLVQPDELFDVPDDHAESYECQPDLYDRVDAAAAKPAPVKAPAKTKESD